MQSKIIFATFVASAMAAGTKAAATNSTAHATNSTVNGTASNNGTSTSRPTSAETANSAAGLFVNAGIVGAVVAGGVALML